MNSHDSDLKLLMKVLNSLKEKEAEFIPLHVPEFYENEWDFNIPSGPVLARRIS